MRYIITQSQFHKLIYTYLDTLFSNGSFEKSYNPYFPNNNVWRIYMYSKNEENLISYFWYGVDESSEDEDYQSNVGKLQIHPTLLDEIRKLFMIRGSKVMDIIADWVSEKFNVDIDEIFVYPERDESPNY